MQAARRLKEMGCCPDVVVIHPGWGEGMFLPEVWPKARYGIYCEFFYGAAGRDTGFDPEIHPARPEDGPRLRVKNLNNLMHFDFADAGLAPTHWQASTFPDSFRHRISVIHDGIDTELVRPDAHADMHIRLSNGLVKLDRRQDVVTYVSRNLEPYRGVHTFMRSLPALFRKRPDAWVLMVGGESVSYGAVPDPVRYGNRSWKQIFMEEIASELPASARDRVVFLGRVPYEHYLRILQISRVHVYLTYPFVLSWSLLEAMSAGCAIVASNTSPVIEAIEDGVTGRLVEFFDPQGLAERVLDLLNNPDESMRLGQAARAFAVERYDLEKVCLPQQIEWISALRI